MTDHQTPTRKVMIVAAMAQELKAILPAYGFKQVGGWWMRQSAGVRWVALSFGIGEQAVNTRLKQAIEKERPQQLIVVGFAGALDPSLHIGDAARIECVMNQNDIAFNLMTMTTVPEHQSAATPSADHARLLTVNEPLITAKAKQDYRAKTACSMVDMESFHIASLAAQMNIPLQIYRSISDEAKDEIPPEVMRWVKSDKIGRAHV